jgi:NAD(P)-dependent dehydrogenase (short-subunit alcohol dehydrogenase family)
MSSATQLSQFRLEGKVALVTGAGKGIGRACASVLASAGAKVVAVARTREDLEQLASESEGDIECWVADVTSDGFLERISTLAQLDILVNNVGTNQPEPFLEVETDTLDHIMGINIRAAFLVAQCAARIMVSQGSGTIIHMGSQMGHVGAPNRTVYCMTKHAIEGLTKAMAVELAPQGVRVNAVAPTFIETPLTKPMFENPAFQEDVLSRIPMGKIGQVEDVANAVLFLASPASGLITGDSLKVDGGWTAI